MLCGSANVAREGACWSNDLGGTIQPRLPASGRFEMLWAWSRSVVMMGPATMPSYPHALASRWSRKSAGIVTSR